MPRSDFPIRRRTPFDSLSPTAAVSAPSSFSPSPSKCPSSLGKKEDLHQRPTAAPCDPFSSSSPSTSPTALERKETAQRHQLRGPTSLSVGDSLLHQFPTPLPFIPSSTLPPSRSPTPFERKTTVQQQHVLGATQSLAGDSIQGQDEELLKTPPPIGDAHLSPLDQRRFKMEDESDTKPLSRPSPTWATSEVPIDGRPGGAVVDSVVGTIYTPRERVIESGGTSKLPSRAALLAMLAGGDGPPTTPTKVPLPARIHLYTLEQIDAKLRKQRHPPGVPRRAFQQLLSSMCSRGDESISSLLERLQRGEVSLSGSRPVLTRQVPNAKYLYSKHRPWIAQEVERVKLLSERKLLLERNQRISARNREREDI